MDLMLCCITRLLCSAASKALLKDVSHAGVPYGHMAVLLLLLLLLLGQTHTRHFKTDHQ